jgi:hypothetical protein
MNDRRTFLKTIASVAAVGSFNAVVADTVDQVPLGPQSGVVDRRYWESVLQRLASPVLGNLAKHELRKAMPVETNGELNNRSRYTHLEAFGRLLAGIAPWLGTKGLEGQEAGLQTNYICERSKGEANVV